MIRGTRRRIVQADDSQDSLTSLQPLVSSQRLQATTPVSWCMKLPVALVGILMLKQIVT